MHKQINYFLTKLNNDQTLVRKKIQSNLIEEWLIQPKSKKKSFYIIYWKLRKNELSAKNKKKQGWIFLPLKKNFLKKSYVYKNQINLKDLNLLNKPVFYKKYKIKNFIRIRLKGYTSYGEKIIDYGKNK